MEDMGTLSASDGPSLEQCASIYSEWRKAKDICDKIGMAHIIKDADGKPVSTKRNAYMSVKKQCEDRLFKYYVEFGMTASSRSTLKAQEKETGENWFEKALRQRTLDN